MFEGRDAAMEQRFERIEKEQRQIVKRLEALERIRSETEPIKISRVEIDTGGIKFQSHKLPCTASVPPAERFFVPVRLSRTCFLAGFLGANDDSPGAEIASP